LSAMSEQLADTIKLNFIRRGLRALWESCCQKSRPKNILTKKFARRFVIVCAVAILSITT
jgi:hypothetical protein